jgi:2-oxoglutarate dehydrogenase E2 component (dihydrolipoamide succinyltransferase)
MMMEIKVPVVGESITEGVLVSWYREAGQAVQVDDDLFELETDKVTMTVKAEVAGTLAIQVPAGSKVTIGQIVGAIEAQSAAGRVSTLPLPTIPDAKPAPAPAPSTPAVDRGGPPLSPPAGFAQAQAKLAAQAELSPAVRRLVAEHGLEPGAIPASGPGGRLTKEDVVRFLETPAPAAPAPAAAPAPVPAPAPTAARPPVPAAPRPPGARETRRPMSSLRHRIAERLVLAQQTAAILTTFNEVDLSRVLALRERHRAAFEKRHGVKLGLMSFFVKAAVDALKTVPALNSQIDGDEIVEHHVYDLGVAVSTEAGLVVPVIRDADRLGFGALELAIADQARRARERKLQLSDLQGGTFTISNGGVYGSLLSTPILNPPQSGILGMHGIKERPVVVDGAIVARPMMYLALSYDHRLVDGEQAVRFLRRVVECIESPERIVLEV